MFLRKTSSAGTHFEEKKRVSFYDLSTLRFRAQGHILGRSWYHNQVVENFRDRLIGITVKLGCSEDFPIWFVRNPPETNGWISSQKLKLWLMRPMRRGFPLFGAQLTRTKTTHFVVGFDRKGRIPGIKVAQQQAKGMALRVSAVLSCIQLRVILLAILKVGVVIGRS